MSAVRLVNDSGAGSVRCALARRMSRGTNWAGSMLLARGSGAVGKAAAAQNVASRQGQRGASKDVAAGALSV